VQEGDERAVCSWAGLLVQESYPLLRKVSQHPRQVLDFQANMMHARPSARQEPLNRACLTDRLQKLDTALPYRQEADTHGITRYVLRLPNRQTHPLRKDL
jgi:hypothetical protein